MAASSSVQSIMSSPMTSISSRASRVNQFSIPAVYMPSLRRNASLRVRSMAEEEQKGQPREPANTVTPPPQPASTRSPKMSTKFSDLMAFAGPAPERINGRLAMIGFVAAMGVELAKGQGVFEQISGGGIPWFLFTSVLLSVASLIPLFQGVSVELAKGQGVFEQISGGGIPWFLGTSVLLSVASLIPLFQGVSVESKSKEVMSSDAEMWNGRLAMLGLIALAFTEYVKGGTLV